MSIENLNIWQQVDTPPQKALKKITAGRLKGFTDINPMWRYKKLTEMYGPCGIGWYVDSVNYWCENGANNEIVAFCSLNLFVKSKDGNGWSQAIYGIGGSKLVAKETNGLYTNDECFKMAYTDAISVACKQLGFAANIYWEGDNNSKYQPAYRGNDDDPLGSNPVCAYCAKPLTEEEYNGKTYSAKQIAAMSYKELGVCLHIACKDKYKQAMEGARK